MSTAELKSSLTEMIADIENPDLLEALHDLLSSRKQQAGVLWNGLSAEQKNEVIEAYHQSNDFEKLTDHEDILRRYS